MVKVLIDSSSDFSLKECEERGLLMVSLSVSMNDKHFRDGRDITKDEFYELLLKSSEFPKTAQPSPQDFLDHFSKVKEDGDELVCVVLSSALSGTYQSALIAKNMVDYDKIYVIDSLSATAGTRILIDVALDMAKKGHSAKEIYEKLEELKGKIRIFAGVGTLEYLAMGGRISKAAATIGSLANIKPVIMVSDEGKVEVVAKCIGVSKAIKTLKDKLSDNPIDLSYPAYYVYTAGEENLDKLKESFKAIGIIDIKTQQIGPTIGAHVGPGAFGICYISK